MDFNFLSPSYKRADSCLTHKLFPSVTYVVAESEAEQYLLNDLNVIQVPDAVQGNNARIRNWILDNYSDKPLLMMDDDITSITMWSEFRKLRLMEDDLFAFVSNHIQMMKDSGCYLGGINLINEPRAYRINNPFSFQTPILGPFNIHIPNPIRYDLELNLKADYDFFLQHIKAYKYALRDNRVFYEHKKNNYKGGCSVIRNTEEEKRQLQKFRIKWGDKYVKLDKKTDGSFDINPIVKI